MKSIAKCKKKKSRKKNTYVRVKLVEFAHNELFISYNLITINCKSNISFLKNYFSVIKVNYQLTGRFRYYLKTSGWIAATGRKYHCRINVIITDIPITS